MLNGQKGSSFPVWNSFVCAPKFPILLVDMAAKRDRTPRNSVLNSREKARTTPMPLVVGRVFAPTTPVQESCFLTGRR
eukprot:3577570-Prorocentrum_lima.AAC.1